jgi:O-antigen/teichoic acid export membrane protein
MQLSIIIPAHNESNRLPAVLREYAQQFADRLGRDFEILVVANHCNDDTAEKAREIASDFPQISVLEEASKIGKGGAVILGTKAAQGDWIGFVDADGATPPHELYRLYEVARCSDGVIASRWLPGAKVTAHQKWLRLLSSRLFNVVTRLLLGLKYHDTQCGAKIFKKEAWQKILPNIGITRFAFDVDILFQLKRGRYRIQEEPTEWHDVAGSKVNILGSSLEMFLAILRMRLIYSPLKPLVGLYDRTISKPVEFLLKDPLFRHTLLLSSAAMIIHACNILFQLAVGRGLPEAEYTLLVTLLSLFNIVSQPSGTLSTAINHYTSILSQKNQQNLLKQLITKWTLLTGIPSIIAAAVAMFFATEIAGYFHLDRTEPIIIAALALPALFVLPVFSGAIGGLQKFWVASISQTAGGIGRVAFTAGFIFLVHPASGWALFGHVGGLYITLLICMFFILPMLQKPGATKQEMPSMRRYLAYTFFISLAGGILVNGDVILIRRYIPENTSFAYAATISRIAVFMAASVVAAMFPKVSSDEGFRPQDRRVYIRAMAYSGFFIASAVLVCLLIPGLLLQLFFGLPSVPQDLVRATRMMGIVMAFATFLSINHTLLAAQRRFRALSPIVLCSAAYLAIVHFWHPDTEAIILIAGAANLLALICTTISILRSPVKRQPPAF